MRLIAKTKDLDVCNVTISDLRDKNDILRAKIVELNSCKHSTSTVEYTTICTRCRDVNIDAIHDHMALIKQQNDHIAKLDAKITEHDLENEKFKFARSMLYRGRHPGIKDGIGFCWGLVLNRYESRTRQHKILNDNDLRPMKHYSLGDNEL
jgi:hypothetical protein